MPPKQIFRKFGKKYYEWWGYWYFKDIMQEEIKNLHAKGYHTKVVKNRGKNKKTYPFVLYARPVKYHYLTTIRTKERAIQWGKQIIKKNPSLSYKLKKLKNKDVYRLYST